MDNKESKTAKERLEIILNNYLASNPINRADGKENEIELRFGSNKKYKPISKIDYNNVAQCLHNFGFKSKNPDGFHSLRISHEYYDAKNKKHKFSNIRTEIEGIDMIKNYCETNSLQKILNMPSTIYEKIKFTQKMKPKDNENVMIEPADFKDFNIRISYQLEQIYTARSQIIRNFVEDWNDRKKTFRLLNRVRFVHDELPVYADLSIVKYGKTSNGVPMKVYTVQDSEVFDQPESYDIEVEIINSEMGVGKKYKDVKTITELLRKCIRMVMTGLQQTNYPISYLEQENIQHEYMQLLFGKQHEKSDVFPNMFLGYQSYALEIKHIMEPNDNMKHPNIRKNYTVTDKADGDRNLLFINREGKLYMIDTNMNIIFTGSKTNEKAFFESLLDGEHIKYDKNGKFINLFAAFDIYYIKDKSTRELPFYRSDEEDAVANRRFRLDELYNFIEKLKIVNVTKSDGPCEFNITCKTFFSTKENDIFYGCSEIMSKMKDATYEYNTDGLIFTPSDKAVAGETDSVAGPLKRIAWDYSFKWKPIEFLTIDFLVTIKKDKNGNDEIKNIYEDGIDITKATNIVQYKTLVLRCGFNEAKHGFINPFNDVIEDKITKLSDMDNTKDYQPVPFSPTNPYDNNAKYANIILRDNTLFTEENEPFDENMIVEFKYVTSKSEGWKWVPLRVRYDKTAQLLSKSKIKNYGNAYHVANNNWQCIHNPITEDMITKGIDIPDFIEENNEEAQTDVNEGIYYNYDDIGRKKSRSMRDFHNLYVKQKLISSIGNKNDTLIDYAVGKGGDLHKWIKSELAFVFGIDLSKDNINNRLNGACARYLKEKNNKKNIPKCIFVNGNSNSNIRRGTAFSSPYGSEKEKEIARAIFGNGPKDPTVLGKAVYNNYGIAENGFNISSCQFALHYFFENETTLNNFIRNLSECTKLHGHFIGCCYDGEQVFKLLRNKNKEESIVLNDGAVKSYELTKLYSQTGFPDDETSLGYKINVYQDTIGSTFKEYLVNFKYFIRIMENYGFTLLSKEEANAIGLPDSTGLFQEMFNNMEEDIKRIRGYKSNIKSAHLMNENEKTVSFLNRYFVFRKSRNVDAAKIMNNMLSKDFDELERIKEKEEKEEKQEESDDEVVSVKKNKVVKIKRKKTEEKEEPKKPEKVIIKKKK